MLSYQICCEECGTAYFPDSDDVRYAPALYCKKCTYPLGTMESHYPGIIANLLDRITELEQRPQGD